MQSGKVFELLITRVFTIGHVLASLAFALFCCAFAVAQETASAPQASSHEPVVLTLKRAIELALQNSKDIQAAKLQATLSDRSANVAKSVFLPNLYAGSGAGYTYGI